jgi:C-terminal processing protease CtpA/Prc
MKLKMQPMLKPLLMSGVLLLSPLALAQSEEDQVKREALRAEIQQARAELAQAAREMARLQRELVEEGVHEGRWTMKKADGDETTEIIIESDGIVIDSDSNVEFFGDVNAFGSTPKLGILVGGGRDADNEVLGLTPGGGAEAAGLQRGDRVIEVNGLTLDNEGNTIGKALQGLEAGTAVPVIVERDGERLSFDVTTSAPERDVRIFAQRFAPEMFDGMVELEGLHEGLEDIHREIIMMHEGDHPFPPGAPMPPRLPGLFVLGGDSDLVSNHEGLAPYFGTGDGVVVLRIGNDNPLQLTDGDVVLSIDGEPVDRPADLGRAMLGRQAGETVILEVMRNGTLTQLEGTVPESRFPGLHIKRGLGQRAPEAPRPPRPPRPPRFAAPAEVY